jgi:hypothetical protein
MKDEIKYLNKFKEGKEKDYNTLPLQREEKGVFGNMFEDMHKKQILPNKKKFKIKRFNKIKVNNIKYEWGYGMFNYDGEENWRLFIFDDDGRKIHSVEPVYLGEYDTEEVRELIGEHSR